MMIETATAVRAPGRDADPDWQAAEKLHVALFTELLRSSALTDALSTGSSSLDSLAFPIIEKVATYLGSTENQLAEQFYQQLKSRRVD